MNLIPARHLSVILTCLICLIFLHGCGGGSSSNNDNADNTQNNDGGTTTSVSVNGSVSAPGGALAFRSHSFFNFLANLVFGNEINAALEGIQPAAGIEVVLIQVDSDGNQVGDVIASATTDGNGDFTLSAPEGFTAATNYVVRAGNLLSARVLDTASVPVDPISHASHTLIAGSISDVSKITIAEAVEIVSTVEEIAQNVEGLSAVIDASAYADSIQTAVLNNEEAENIILNSAESGAICGTVTDSGSSPLENIRIIVKRYIDPITIAKATTDSQGDYCVNVPDGNYIIGAFNFTDTSLGASEWWTSSAGTGIGATSQFTAEPIVVSGSIPITADFQLQAGARVSGSVLAASGGSLTEGAPLEGVKIEIRDFESYIPLVKARVQADGSFVVNIPAGRYILFAENRTRLPYASGYEGNADNRDLVLPLIVSANDSIVKNFSLNPGYKITGEVLDGPGGTPISGMRVRVNRSGPAARLRTNKLGKYRIWLKPNVPYTIQSHGQTASISSLDANTNQDFTDAMVEITARIIDSNSAPVNEAKLFLTETGTVSQELTNADGLVTLYAPASGGSYTLQVRFDALQPVGSSWYNNQTNKADAETITVSTDTDLDLGDWQVADGGVLTGKVFTDAGATTPDTHIKVSVRKNTGGDFFVSTNTRGDGSFSISLPADSNAYDRIRIAASGGNIDINSSVIITAGETTDLGNITP